MEIKYTKNEPEEVEIGDVQIGSTVKITSGNRSGIIGLLTGSTKQNLSWLVDLTGEFDVIAVTMETKAVVIPSTLSLDT